MNLDKTFCSNKKCKNEKCDRNQNNYDLSILAIGNHPISISHFKECKDWKE